MNKEDIFKSIASLNHAKSNCAKATMQSVSVVPLNPGKTERVIIKSSSKQNSNKIRNKKNCFTNVTHTHLSAIPSTSNDLNDTLDYSENNFPTENAQDPPVILQSSPSHNDLSSQETVFNEIQNQNFDATKSKKRKIVIENDADEQDSYESSSVMLKNCVIHQLTVNHNSYSNKNKNESTV